MYPINKDYKFEKKDECCNIYITVNCEKSEKKPCYASIDTDKWSRDNEDCNVNIIINCCHEEKKHDK